MEADEVIIKLEELDEENLWSDSSECESDDDSDNNSTFQISTGENAMNTPPPLDNYLSEISSAIDISEIVVYLTPDEGTIINNCEDPSLKELLILNRIKKHQMKETARKFSSMLNQCKNQILVEENNGDCIASKRSQNPLVRMGSSYFRYKSGHSYACNEDTARMRLTNDINTLILPKRNFWNGIQQSKVKSDILLKYSKHKLEYYTKQLKDLEANVGVNEDSKEIIKARIDLEDWKSKIKNNCVDAPPRWDDSFINWDEYAANELLDPEMSKAVRAFWNLHLHPDIKKIAHTDEENAAIISLAEKYGGQNWDAIGTELGNDRSAYTDCMHYMSNLCDSYTQYPFTKEEDNLLRSTIKGIRMGHVISWNKVVAQFDGRSREQLYNRCVHLNLNNMNYKIGKFSDGEDVTLLCLVRKYGENFSKISAEIPSRSKSQLMQRYFGTLKCKDNLFGSYTVEEDKTILKHVEKYNGSRKWSELSTMVKRNKASLRLRYSVLKKFFTKHPDKTLYDISRRKEWRTLNDKYARKHKLANQSSEANILPNLEIENKIRSNKAGRPQRTLMDNELVHFFRTTTRSHRYRHKKTVHADKLKECASTIDTILKMLGVKLDIPEKLDTASGVLEDIDVELLNILRQATDQQPTSSRCSRRSAIFQDIPPNISTTQGLRALLLWNKKNRFNNKIASVIKPEEDLKVFAERFASLFRWPHLMSITQPEQRIVHGEEPERDAMAWRKHRTKGGGPITNDWETISEVSNIHTVHVPNDWRNAGDSGNTKMYGGKKKVATKKDVMIGPTVVNRCKPSHPSTDNTNTGKSPVAYLKPLDKATVARLKLENKLNAITSLEAPDLKTPEVMGVIEIIDDLETDGSQKIVSSIPALSSGPTVLSRCKPSQPSTSSTSTGKSPVAYNPMHPLNKTAVSRLRSKLDHKLPVVTSLKAPDQKPSVITQVINVKDIIDDWTDRSQVVVSSKPVLSSGPTVINGCKPPQPFTSNINNGKLPVAYLKPLDKATVARLKLENKLNSVTSLKAPVSDQLSKLLSPTKTIPSKPINKQMSTNTSDLPSTMPSNINITPSKDGYCTGILRSILETPSASLVATVPAKKPNETVTIIKPSIVKATTRISNGVKTDTQQPISLPRWSLNHNISHNDDNTIGKKRKLRQNGEKLIAKATYSKRKKPECIEISSDSD